MRKASLVLAKGYKAVVAILAGALLLYLSLLSLFSSSYVHIGEKVYYTADLPWPLLLLFVLLCAGVVLLRRFVPGLPATLASPWVKRGILAAAGFAAVFWVFATQPVPTADQLMVANIAAAMREGDFSAFAQGGYLELHNHQLGIVLFLYLLSFPFGVHNYLAFQLCNVAALLVCYCMLYKINTLTGASPRREGVVLVVSVSCLPLMLYTTFVYGTLLGFALVLVGMWQALLCLHAKSRRAKAVHMVFAALALGAGIAAKGNYLVVMVAVCIMLVVYAATHKRLVGAVCAVVILLGYILVGRAVGWAGQGIAGVALDGGVPTTARIAMGLQESARGPGWYNDYVEVVYLVNDYDSKAASQEAVQNIRERVGEFAATPYYALEFFGKKTASQWNDPTFASLWVNNSNRMDTSTPRWAWEIVSGNGALWYIGFCNAYQSLLLLGAFAGLALRRQRLTQLSLLLALTFLGGFLLYLVWEAKSQYTLPFFFLLAPLAVEGYAAIAARATDITQKLRAGEITAGRAVKTRLVVFAAALLVCVLALSIANRRVLDVTLKPAEDSEYYEEILQAYRNARYEDYLEGGT